MQGWGGLTEEVVLKLRPKVFESQLLKSWGIVRVKVLEQDFLEWKES
jgi:hypothetical protein